MEKRSNLDILWELVDDLEEKIEATLDAKWTIEHFH